MRKMLVLLALLWAVPVRAADPAVLKDGDVLRGRFVQERHLQGFAQPIRSQGTFVIAPGRGLIWRAETPFAVTTVVTPAGLAQSVNGTETNRLAATRLPFLSKLYDMMAGALAGDWRSLDGTFAITRQTGRVMLAPKKADDPVAQQIAGISARLDRFVEEVEITKPGGDRDRLLFSNQVLNARPLDAEEAVLLR
ncbi:MAG: outer membrane lipoprotein carrier protein LolA [Magnetospirillum gryphiswaldense]|nr:outer membrane lipoprotein carrier protein LolA [Magnetospirillum gryphiswaldense]